MTAGRDHAWRRGLDAVARALHEVHGTRGILMSSLLLIAWTTVEPAVGAVTGAAVAVPLLLLFVAGLVTLPREGVAVQERGRRLAHGNEAMHALLRRSLWLFLLVVLLLPHVFLPLYGIPHLSPLAGFIRPGALRRIATIHIAAILLVAVLYLRSSRREAPDVIPLRPKDLADRAGGHLARQGFQIALAVLVVTWLTLLADFWQPFSLFQWPPGPASLSSPRAATSLAITTAPPALLMCGLAGHLEHLWVLYRQRLLAARSREAFLSALLAFGTIVAAWLHARELLWVARYQQAGML